MDKKIELYTTRFCPFCSRAKALLDHKGYKYDLYELDQDQTRKKELEDETGQNTVPYVFIDGELIGGFDDLKALDDQGKL